MKTVPNDSRDDSAKSKDLREKDVDGEMNDREESKDKSNSNGVTEINPTSDEEVEETKDEGDPVQDFVSYVQNKTPNINNAEFLSQKEYDAIIKFYSETVNWIIMFSSVFANAFNRNVAITMIFVSIASVLIVYVVTWDRVNTLAFRRTLQYGILGIWMVKLRIEKRSTEKDHIAYMT